MLLLNSKSSGRNCCSILFLALMLLASDGWAQVAMTASGCLTETMFNGAISVPSESSSNRFNATISQDGKFALEVRPIHQHGDFLEGKEDVIYMTYDGSDTYFCQYTEAVQGVTNGRPGIIRTEAITNRAQLAYISPGNYPFSPYDSQKRTHILWLVFGAGPMLHDSQPETMPLPWIPARWMLLSYGFSIKYELCANFPFFPSNLQFVRDSKLDFDSEIKEYNRPELDSHGQREWVSNWENELQKRKQWRDGDIAGKLETGDFTNYAGFCLPLSFKFSTFIRSGQIRRLYTVEVTGLETNQFDDMASITNFHPPILADLYIADSRFRMHDSSRGINYIHYNLDHDKDWMPTNSASLEKLYANYLATPSLAMKPPLSPLTKNAKTRFVFVILLLLLILPFALFLKFGLLQSKAK